MNPIDQDVDVQNWQRALPNVDRAVLRTWLGQMPTFQAAIGEALRMICLSTGWAFAEVWQPNSEQTCLDCSPVWFVQPRLAEFSFAPFRLLSQQRTFAPGQGLPGRIWQSKQPEWMPDVSQATDQEFLRVPIAAEMGLKAALGVPVLANEQVLAVLVFFMTEAQFEDQDVIKTVSAIAAELGMWRSSAPPEPQTEEFLRLLLDSLPISIFWKDRQSTYLGCNQHFARMVGVPVEEIRGKTDYDLPYPQVAVERFRQQDRQIVESGQAKMNLLESTTLKNGKQLWLNVNKIPIRDNHQRVIGVMGTLEDITDRQKAAFGLQQAEQKYRSIFENAVEGIFQTTLSGHYLMVNPMLAKIYGYDSPEDLMNRLTDIEHQLYVQPDRRREFIQQIQEQGSIRGFESEVYRKDGKIIWVSESARAIRDEHGQIVGYEGTVEDITSRKQAEATIRYQAFHDLLTGLPNRTLFNDRLPLALSHAQRSNTILAVMFLDLDRFKIINDTLGHAIGDQLLQEVAYRLSRCLREGDTVSRWGGDEFTLLLPQINTPEDASKIAQRLIEALKPTFELSGHTLHISSSIGVALYPHDGQDAQTLLKNADAALYRAKDQGRNGYQFYTPAINSKASELLALENSLHDALERQEFIIYYQPQINLTTGEITQMEALVRWQHPDLGFVSPAVFIPLAEENGLIVPIGEWVLRTACAQHRLWQDMGLSSLRIAVNLSARQFHQQRLLETVSQILTEVTLDPACLELEIAETTAMQDVNFTASLLQQLRTMGVHIAVDDFGTGYSALSYLKKFPLNTIKIDQSFIQDLTTDDRDSAIVAAVIALGRGLNLNVVAEGVETQEQLAVLRSLGCEEMQGYLFSQPMPASQATQFLQSYGQS
ncbi:EAL domain-containing protein [Pantanalinema sp. GBBB05]|uniref:EAL domain-containing protein n=1 Tax=Pantanalinema sp. GBBB05 TaxID=2604139 RepID=UPI001D3D521C|nr:EAL domain-containing protein [Pantanalinema sp. GBBB05]